MTGASSLLSHPISIVELFDHLITEAVEKEASDIHIEVFSSYAQVRFRCDGLLQLITTLSIDRYIQLVSRIKILTNLNIAERRLPQDGRFSCLPHQLHLRVSICPTLYGEKVVIRLLPAHHHLNLWSLGLEEKQYHLLLKQLSQPHGLILVVGPTGSGKTSTLHAAIQHVSDPSKNILSIEDPIEIQYDGINQINTNEVIDFNFTQAIRCALRQDPDVLMVGEIRDALTACTAIQAAQTGHLVLSSMHAKNAVECLARLQTFDIHSQQLLNVCHLVISQRLLRMLCSHCKRPDQPHRNTRYSAQGCEKCYQGYKGRIAIFELFSPPMDSPFFSPIKPTHNKMLTLAQSAMLKIQRGISTFEEAQRVLGSDAFITPKE